MPEDEKPEKKSKDLPTKSKEAAEQAREQAEEYGSIFVSTRLEFDNGDSILIPPHPVMRMLDDDEQTAYDQLLFESESFDRHPDEAIPEQKIYDANSNLVTTLEPSTRKGAVIGPPYRKDGKLITPSWEVQTVQAALGPEKYAKLREGRINGERGAARDVWHIWNQQNLALSERRASDPKSNGSTVDLAPVPEGDSAGSAPVPPTPDS